jgi:hypothetical protein
MEINKDSIVLSICGIDSNITLENLSKHLKMDVEEFIESKQYGIYIPALGVGEGRVFEMDGKLLFDWDGSEDLGITQLLKDIFNEEYLLRIDTNVSYRGELYIEVEVWDNQKEIIENVLNHNGDELTPEEKNIHDNRPSFPNHYNIEDISFIKKSEFNKEEIEGQPILPYHLQNQDTLAELNSEEEKQQLMEQETVNRMEVKNILKGTPFEKYTDKCHEKGIFTMKDYEDLKRVGGSAKVVSEIITDPKEQIAFNFFLLDKSLGI